MWPELRVSVAWVGIYVWHEYCVEMVSVFLCAAVTLVDVIVGTLIYKCVPSSSCVDAG